MAGTLYDSTKNRGGSTYTAPTKPVKGDTWLECPVTGLDYPQGEMIWSRGRFVHPKAYDEPGYREYVIDGEPPPETPSSDAAPIDDINGF